MKTCKTKRVKYSEQINIFISKEEKETLEKIRVLLKGTNSQVIRLALTQFAKNLELKKIISGDLNGKN